MPAWICVTCGVQHPDTASHRRCARSPGRAPVRRLGRPAVDHRPSSPATTPSTCARRNPTSSGSASSRPSRSGSARCWSAPRAATCCGTASPCSTTRRRERIEELGRHRRDLHVPPAFLRGQRRVRGRVRCPGPAPARRQGVDPAAVAADRAVRRRGRAGPRGDRGPDRRPLRRAAVLHWPAGSDGRGALLTGDTITVVQDREWVSFMWSYPNLIPLDAATVRGHRPPRRTVRLRPDLRRLVGAGRGPRRPGRGPPLGDRYVARLHGERPTGEPAKNSRSD